MKLHTLRIANNKLVLLAILLLGFSLRMFGMNWDNGWHLHPDERMLIMVTERIRFFSHMDPDFFNYGSLPVYILKGASDIVSFFSRTNISNYHGMLGIGRTVSVIIDCITLLMVFKISRKLFKREAVSLVATWIYAVSVFPIQNAHFFIVDPVLTMFVTSTIYLLIRYLEEPSKNKIVLIALFSAGAITTKFTGILLLPIIVVTFLARMFLIQKSSTIKKTVVFFSEGTLFTSLLVAFAFLFMPFGFLHHEQFITEITLQLRMNSDPLIFPYTLQYVGTASYGYYLKNIFLWGLGPVICSLVIIGSVNLAKKLIQMRPSYSDFSFLIIICYFLIHFTLIGKSAVKFMRYMLPLYPFFAVLAGYGLYRIRSSSFGKYVTIPALILTVVWTLLFMSIYTRPHTRIQASEWIYEQIPAGSTIAVEHWDDQLPLPLSKNNWPSMYDTYQFEILELYNPDTDAKWQKIEDQLARADYIVIASNRLYTPLQKLTDCNNLPSDRCYPKTADYYQKLFKDEHSFYKVAEFTSYPGLRLGNLKFEINDQGADESFTVYDHPKVIVFKKK
ncbi:glycosyltransferase family 39 protein [Candidatus Roizmanbacteria bacterium]|nr:glycosyltransferase family 39 protein [Candidatus Roizmanbacteria bacterium]